MLRVQERRIRFPSGLHRGISVIRELLKRQRRLRFNWDKMRMKNKKIMRLEQGEGEFNIFALFFSVHSKISLVQKIHTGGPLSLKNPGTFEIKKATKIYQNHEKRKNPWLFFGQTRGMKWESYN